MWWVVGGEEVEPGSVELTVEHLECEGEGREEGSERSMSSGRIFFLKKGRTLACSHIDEKQRWKNVR